MRLLNVHTRQLKSFIGSRIPPYAILSHTWGDDEVVFNDVGASGWMEKQGYTKVKYMCDHVAQATPKLDWVWIDTLCINKDSSSELSEAINSMFAWYTGASVCYAYLEDVDAVSIKQDLPQAKWFTRGWTLQELLAPGRVEFYGKGWIKLGTKDTTNAHVTDFMTTLAHITGIDELVLWKPAYMRAKSVAARMSWASKRQTTRREDLAYCLMGLFDVNMPLLYGEGDRAFLRLQEEIIRISDDHSIFVWDRKLDGPRALSCFATSPSDFRRGTLVVPFGRKHKDISPYALTNQGLQITLRLHHTAQSDLSYGVLNCHFANTLTECIGIPLQPTSNAQVYERLAHYNPDSIEIKEIHATPKNIFLSTRSKSQLPFAAELSLLIYDGDLVDKLGFSPVEVVEPIHSACHWHPDYGNHRLRWLASRQDNANLKIRLTWRHEKGDRYALRMQLDCRIGNSAGMFSVHAIKVLREGDTTAVTRKGMASSSDASLSIKTAQPPGLKQMLRATIDSQDFLGNEVFTLKLEAI